MRRLFARKLIALAGATIALPFLAATASAGTSPQPTQVPDSAITPTTATMGGASVLPTTRTVAHWHGAATDPHNGVTYGFNMVGADPAANSSTTITTDIIPVNVVVDGMTFNGSDVVQPTLDSPVFALNDYASTKYVTQPVANGGWFTKGGPLSSGNKAVQLEDATMRSQFNRQGTGYHVILNPVVHDPITIDVPSNEGTLLQSARGVIAPDININWWSAQLQNLDASLSYMDPTHLPVYLTDNVMLYIGSSPLNCCVIGYHGAAKVTGNGGGSVNGNGNDAVQTFAWASYVTPGFFSPARDWALQDIHALSHEIAEWGDDPFTNNTVEPWLTPTAPQYGCTGLLETGDPVVGIGFTMGTNTFEQGATPNGTQVADGYYHPEDEALMPWFMRLSPSTAQDGRYTFMGNLNPYPGFRQPATGC
ncbi:MAG: hypothetical protein ACM32E_31215 [Gemmatimonadota bacterium]